MPLHEGVASIPGVAHMAAAQGVPTTCLWQLPAPSHRPLSPQPVVGSDAHPGALGTSPARNGRQDPGAGATLQLRHGPGQAATSQQAPSTQLPESHSAGARHALPSGFSPQTREGKHMRPGAQSRLVVQEVRHAPALHVNGVQDWFPPAWHAPAPSHVAGTTRSTVEAQLAARHTVPALCLRHAPAPSQVPSSLQPSRASSGHTSRGSSPSRTGAHVPADAGPLHAWHISAHSEMQHTRSTQKPLVHSPPPEQGAPFGRGASGVAPSPAPPSREQTSPRRSPSASSCRGFGAPGQLSMSSGTPSPSESRSVPAFNVTRARFCFPTCRSATRAPWDTGLPLRSPVASMRNDSSSFG